MNAQIFLEGGGNSKELHTRCREGFRKLLKGCGFEGRMPRLAACGSRTDAFRDFKTASRSARPEDLLALLIDSEEPVEEIERTWQHLAARDGWVRPAGAEDDQVFLMTTCMETWIVCDVETLKSHYGAKLQASALPDRKGIEGRGRAEVQNALQHATRNCSNGYAKGRPSFQVLGELKAQALAEHLPSFARMRRILDEKLR